MCGTSEERRRARDYLDWLIAQRTGPVSVEVLDRDDVTVMEVRCSSCSLSLCCLLLLPLSLLSLPRLLPPLPLAAPPSLCF